MHFYEFSFELLTLFVDDDLIFIFIYNIKTGSVGKDPESSSYGVFADPWRLDSGQILAYIVRQPAPAADNGPEQELFFIYLGGKPWKHVVVHQGGVCNRGPCIAFPF